MCLVRMEIGEDQGAVTLPVGAETACIKIATTHRGSVAMRSGPIIHTEMGN